MLSLCNAFVVGDVPLSRPVHARLLDSVTTNAITTAHPTLLDFPHRAHEQTDKCKNIVKSKQKDDSNDC